MCHNNHRSRLGSFVMQRSECVMKCPSRSENATLSHLYRNHGLSLSRPYDAYQDQTHVYYRSIDLIPSLFQFYLPYKIDIHLKQKWFILINRKWISINGFG